MTPASKPDPQPNADEIQQSRHIIVDAFIAAGVAGIPREVPVNELRMGIARALAEVRAEFVAEVRALRDAVEALAEHNREAPSSAPDAADLDLAERLFEIACNYDREGTEARRAIAVEIARHREEERAAQREECTVAADRAARKWDVHPDARADVERAILGAGQ